MKRKSLLAIVLGCLFFTSTRAQQDQKRLNAYIDSFTSKLLEQIPSIPAMTVTIVSDKGTVFNKAYGWANKETGLKADVNTAFYIASSTKSFTALAAALLDRDKKIMLDSPVKKYFKNTAFSADISSDVTIRSLLNHTSGLENGPLPFRLAYSGMSDTNEMLHLLAEATTVRAKPGIYKYDNLGYNIYALAVQQTLNIAWQDLLQEKIFKPLGMTRTSAYLSAAKKGNWPVAVPYNAYGLNGLERVYLEKTDNTMQSAGGLISTPSDIALWLQAQINYGKVGNKKIFPEEVISATQKGTATFEKAGGFFSASGKYGLGWSVSQYRDNPLVYHFGGFPGYRSHISFMPHKKMGVAIFVNEGSIGGAASDIIASLVYDWIAGANLEEEGRKKMDQLMAIHQRESEGSQRSYADRAKRTWQLSLPLETYTGKYTHPYYGDISISMENNVLAVKMGNLHAVSTPFTQKESIRVELIPGSGQVVQFQLDEQGKVNKLSYDRLEFQRVK
jgi:CubicO group peptidase (beta-lactamase class C family)